MVNYPPVSHTAAADKFTVHTASSLSGPREARRSGKGGEAMIPHSP
jgi:hypothetical protein